MGTVKDGFRVAQAVVRVMADSTRTDEIHRTEEITARPRLRELLAEYAQTDEGRRIMALRPELRSDLVDYDALRKLPEDTLGGAYVHHLDSNGITADYQAQPTQYCDDPDIAYLVRRFRQTHDVWHALLGLGITGHEEVIVHWFTYGQLRLPHSVMIMLFGTLKHVVLERRWPIMRHTLGEAYRAGREAKPLLAVVWEDHWAEPIADVRQDYGIHPLDRRWLE